VTADSPATDSVAVNRSGSGVVNATALLQTPTEPIGAATSPPNDLDADGRYEDVNGNGEFDIVDVNAIFQSRDSDVVRNNPAAFDYNGNGEFDIVDINRLFQMSVERRA
jgi:PKD repeat protein